MIGKRTNGKSLNRKNLLQNTELKMGYLSQKWWHTPVTSALLRQEGHLEFEAGLDCTVRPVSTNKQSEYHLYQLHTKIYLNHTKLKQLEVNKMYFLLMHEQTEILFLNRFSY